MTLQHKIFQDRINGLNEQIPAGGGNGFGQTDPSIPSIQQIGNVPLRGRSSSTQRMTTRALYGSTLSFELWDISPKFQEMWDTYITAGGAWQKDVPWPGLPVFINPETGENVRFELPEPGEMQWPPEGPAFEYWASVLMWFIDGSGTARGWPGGNADWCPAGNCHHSPLWRIWIQGGQPELSQQFINLISAIGSNNQFWFLVMMGTNPTNNEPLSEGDNFYDEYVMFWDIFFGGQWGPGGED